VYLAALDITLTIYGTADSIEVSDSNAYVTLDMCAGCEVVVETTSRRIMTTDLSQNPNLLCDSSKSWMTINTDQTVVITPDAFEVCTSSSGGGSSGSSPTVVTPTNTTVVINDDAETTDSHNVTLSLAANDASLMMISNDPNFVDVSTWEDYAISKSWALNAGEGTKTVYAKFRSSSGGDSSTVSDTITYSMPAEEEQTPEQPVEENITPIVGSLVKGPGQSSVYLLVNGVLRPIPNSKVFGANGYGWEDITEINLSSYSVGEDLGYPENYNFIDGMLVKGSDAKVYAVSNGLRRWIKTEAVFTGLGYQFYNVHNISDQQLATYGLGDDIISTNSHPDGSLVKYSTANNVYRLENGLKRWITTENAFNSAGYDWSLIIEIDVTETYDNGMNIN